MITFKNHIKKAMLLGVAFLGFQGLQAQLSGNYTIDANNKTAGTNFESFKDFESALYSNGVSSAVTVQVVAKSGPYNEQVIFRVPSSNAPNGKSPVVIYGNGNTITYSASSSAYYTVALNGIDYLTLNNLDIVAANSTYAWGVWITNSADYNTIDSCKITCPNSTSTGTQGIGVVFSSSGTSYSSGAANGYYNKIQNSLIKGTTTGGFYIGISYYGNSYSTTTGNQFINNDIQDCYYAGYYFRYGLGDKVSNNRISRPLRTNTTTFYGLYAYYGSDLDVSNNKVFDCFKNMATNTNNFYGISVSYGYGYNKAKYNNNAIYNNSHDGYYYGLYLYPYCAMYSDVEIINNTVQYEQNNKSATNYIQVYGIYSYHTYQSSLTTTMCNNVIDLRAYTSSGYMYGIYWYNPSGTKDHTNNLFNLRYATGMGFYFGYDAGFGPYNSLSDMQNAGLEKNSYEAVPVYQDLANGKLGLASISLDNRGRGGLSVKTDINGKTRNATTPDQGAFELDIDLKTKSVSLPKASECQFKTQAVTIQIVNNSAFALANPTVEYRVDAGAPVVETMNSTIASGATVSYTFTKLLEMPAGAHTLYGYVQSRFAENASYAFTGALAPTGSDFIKGSGFVGTFNSGNPGDPDVVANPDKLVYELKAPTGYSNNRFGKDWVISSLNFKELVGGAAVPSTDTVTVLPGIANGKMTFTPSKTITDKIYKVDYTIYSMTTGCDAPVISREILVAPRPIMDFEVAPACGGSKSNFIGKSSVTSGSYSVVWDFGDGSTSDYVNPKHLYANSGTYQVKLVATSDRGYKDSITKTVGVYDNPVANFTYTNTCDMNPATFTATSTSPNAGTIVNSFDFGDGNTATGNSLTHTYSNFGEFTVVLTTTDAVGCVTKVSKNFTHSEKPNATFVVNGGSLICSNASTEFTNTSSNGSGVGYEWDFGDNNSAVTNNATHTYAADGSFDVTLTARSEAGCKDVVTKTVTVEKGADIKFGYSGNCNGQLVTFTNSTVDPAGTTYNWNFGDGSTSTDRAAVHKYGAIGEFTVEVIASTGAGCISKSEQTIVVGEKPIAFFSTTKDNACTGDNIDINNGSYASSSTLAYTWDLGNGSSSTDMAPSVTYTTAGTKTITLITKAGACSDTATQTVVVTAIPNANFDAPTEGLGLGGVVFNPAIPNGSGTYVWTLGDGTIKKDKTSFTYRYAPTGYFRACLERNDNGCISIECNDITINAASVTKATENGLNVYPNPSKGTFTLMPANASIGMSTVSVVNAVGQVILNVNVDLTSGYTMNLDNVASGIYTVNVISGNTQYNQKVTIVK